MNTSHDDPDAKEFADILAGLGGLAERIGWKRYPGPAWAPPGRRGLRHAMAWAAAAAAVAVLLLAVYGPWWLSPPAGPSDAGPLAPGPGAESAATQVARSRQAEDPYADWRIPWSMNPSLVGTLDLDPSSLPILSIDKATGFEWQIPSLSFPVFEERSRNDDAKQDSDTDGSGGGGRSGRLDDDGAAAGPALVS